MEDWAIVEENNGGVCDRFATEQEAKDALAEGGYPEGCEVAYEPVEPGVFD